MRFLAGTMTLITFALSPLCWAQGSGDNRYVQKNLVSDTRAFSPVTVDPNLVNSWGIANLPGAPFWINDNGKGLATLYDGLGDIVSLVVTIPPPAGSPAGTISAPTGIVANANSFLFIIPGTAFAADFIFATEDGTISAWSPQVSLTQAQLVFPK